MTGDKHPTSFPLRLSPSLRNAALRFAKQDNVSLNHFISMAVAEKVSRMEQAEWLKNRQRQVMERKPGSEFASQSLPLRK